MRLLFDQNISFPLVNRITDIFPETVQVRQLKLENATDKEIWNFAATNNYAIVTFDADFCDLSVLLGYPPKIIWIRTGNTKTSNLEKLLRKNQYLIQEFLKDKKAGCLKLFGE